MREVDQAPAVAGAQPVNQPLPVMSPLPLACASARTVSAIFLFLVEVEPGSRLPDTEFGRVDVSEG